MTRTGAPAPRPRRFGQSLLAAVVAVPVVAAAVGLGLAAQTALGGGEDDHGHGAPAVAVERAGDRRVTAVAVATQSETVQSGVRAVVSVRPAADEPGAADVRLVLRDAASGVPVEPPSRPMAWADRRAASAAGAAPPPADCTDKVRAYRQGGLGSTAEMDLNAYDVLTMNGDGTISVIDPLTSVGGMTQLRDMVTLGSPGEDWVASQDGRRLFVTLPEAGEVAVVDVEAFELTHRVEVGGRPVRAALDPGGRRLWVTDDGAHGGVAVVDTRTLEVLHAVRTGAGPHTLAFTGAPDRWGSGPAAHSSADHDPARGADGEHPASGPDAALVVVGNGSDGTVAVVDPLSLEVVDTVEVGAPVTDLAASDAALVHVAGGPGAPVMVLDPARAAAVARLDVLSGTTALRFSPDGRWGFAVATDRDRLVVFDSRTARVVHTEDGVGRSPDRVVFTGGYAYVHSAGSAEIGVVDLARLGSARALPLVRVSGGQRPPSEGGGTAAADPVFPLHGSEALFVNPADRYVYSYMEGMNAPMGGHQSYGPAPRAVRVVDRSLREVGPGEYVARVGLAHPGDYELALLLDSPRVVSCSSFSARPPSGGEAAPAAVHVSVPPSPARTTAGAPTTFRFALAEDTPAAAPVDADDVVVIGTEAAGLAGDRATATSLGGGRYEVELVLGRPGSYALRVAVPSRGVGIGDLPATAVRVEGRRPGRR